MRGFFEENAKVEEYSFGQEMSLGINVGNPHVKNIVLSGIRGLIRNTQ